MQQGRHRAHARPFCRYCCVGMLSSLHAGLGLGVFGPGADGGVRLLQLGLEVQDLGPSLTIDVGSGPRVQPGSRHAALAGEAAGGDACAAQAMSHKCSCWCKRTVACSSSLALPKSNLNATSALRGEAGLLHLYAILIDTSAIVLLSPTPLQPTAWHSESEPTHPQWPAACNQQVQTAAKYHFLVGGDTHLAS